MSSSGHRARQNAANAIDREAVGNGKGNGMSGGPKRENLEDIFLGIACHIPKKSQIH